MQSTCCGLTAPSRERTQLVVPLVPDSWNNLLRGRTPIRPCVIKSCSGCVQRVTLQRCYQALRKAWSAAGSGRCVPPLVLVAEGDASAFCALAASGSFCEASAAASAGPRGHHPVCWGVTHSVACAAALERACCPVAWPGRCLSLILLVLIVSQRDMCQRGATKRIGGIMRLRCTWPKLGCADLDGRLASSTLPQHAWFIIDCKLQHDPNPTRGGAAPMRAQSGSTASCNAAAVQSCLTHQCTDPRALSVSAAPRSHHR